MREVNTFTNSTKLLKSFEKQKRGYLLGFVPRSRSRFQGAAGSRSRRWTAPRTGPRGDPRPGGGDCAEVPTSGSEAGAGDFGELSRLGLARGSGSSGNRKRSMKRNRASNSAVCRMRPRKSGDRKPRVAFAALSVGSWRREEVAQTPRTPTRARTDGARSRRRSPGLAREGTCPRWVRSAPAKVRAAPGPPSSAQGSFHSDARPRGGQARARAAGGRRGEANADPAPGADRAPRPARRRPESPVPRRGRGAGGYSPPGGGAKKVSRPSQG